MDSADVGMSHLFPQQNLTLKTLHCFRITGDVRANGFQRNTVVEGLIFGLIDGPHSAFGDVPDDSKAASNNSGNGQCRNRRCRVKWGLPSTSSKDITCSKRSWFWPQ